jgi:hypothetical protein
MLVERNVTDHKTIWRTTNPCICPDILVTAQQNFWNALLNFAAHQPLPTLARNVTTPETYGRGFHTSLQLPNGCLPLLPMCLANADLTFI